MSLNMDIDEWKKGIPQRELEQKIREYEEDYPKREKMTPQARENNQTRFFLEDRFYELHKQQLADMLKKQAEGNVLFGFGMDNQGIIPIAKDSSSEGYASSGKHALSSSYSGGEQGGAYSGRGLDSANTGLEASALTPASYGATGGNGGQQLAGGYGNGYTADYVQPAVAAEKGQSMHTFYNEILPNDYLQRLNNLDASNQVSKFDVSSLVKKPFSDYLDDMFIQSAWEKRDKGGLSRKFESRKGPFDIGEDKSGGFSYGTYQMASKPGKIGECINYWKHNGYEDIAQALTKAGGNSGALERRPEFETAWLEQAQRPDFRQAEYDCIEATNFKPLLKYFSHSDWLDLPKRNPVISDALFSASVQHGPGFGRKLNDVFPQSEESMRALSDADVVNLIYNRRSSMGPASPDEYSGIKKGVKDRYSVERKTALDALEGVKSY